MLKHPRTPPANNPALDYQTADSEHVLKRPRPFGMSEEVRNMPFTVFLSPLWVWWLWGVGVVILFLGLVRSSAALEILLLE